MKIENIFLNMLYFFLKQIPFTKLRRYLRNEFNQKHVKFVQNKEIKLQLSIKDYLLSNYIEPYFLEEHIKYNCLFKAKKNIEQNVIWQYWAQGINDNTPKVVKACFNSVTKFKGSYQQIILNDKNIEEYIDIPFEIKEKYNKGIIKPVFFSDFLRLYLLSVYGGVWIDATILLTNYIPEDVLKSDFFMFERSNLLSESEKDMWLNFDFRYFSFSQNFQVQCLTSFLVAKKGNCCAITLRNLLFKYWIRENGAIHYFILQIMYNILKDKSELYKILPSISDTKPHIARLYLNDYYSNELWQKIVDSCFAHKLTYIEEIKSGSVYEYILNFK